MKTFRINEIRSGGQTGVDRAALDAAIENNIIHGGWCPKGRLSEAGTIPEKYLLNETPSEDYSERTTWNIRDSDGTLIFVPTLPLNVTDGTVLTIEQVKMQNKPYLIVDMSKQVDAEKILNWINEHDINILNVAGPRESQSPGIYVECLKILNTLCSQFKSKMSLK